MARVGPRIRIAETPVILQGYSRLEDSPHRQSQKADSSSPPWSFLEWLMWSFVIGVNLLLFFEVLSLKSDLRNTRRALDAVSVCDAMAMIAPP